MIEFIAQIKKVECKTLASNDVGYSVLMQSEDRNIKNLMDMQGEILVNVRVEPNNVEPNGVV
jgi:hypothetical protein